MTALMVPLTIVRGTQYSPGWLAPFLWALTAVLVLAWLLTFRRPFSHLPLPTVHRNPDRSVTFKFQAILRARSSRVKREANALVYDLRKFCADHPLEEGATWDGIPMYTINELFDARVRMIIREFDRRRIVVGRPTSMWLSDLGWSDKRLRLADLIEAGAARL